MRAVFLRSNSLHGHRHASFKEWQAATLEMELRSCVADVSFSASTAEQLMQSSASRFIALLLLYLQLCAAISQLNQSTITTQEDLNVSASPFDIWDCAENTRYVRWLLSAVPGLVERAAAEARVGTRSRHGFTALFKSDKNIEPVVSILNDIYHVKALPGLFPRPSRSGPPALICASPESRAKHPWVQLDPWFECSGPMPFPPQTAFQVQGSRAIFLCPVFFVMPPAPPPGSQCPSVIKNKWVDHTARGFFQYQTYVLIHEMIHFYLGKRTLGPDTKPKEQYGLDNTINLWEQNCPRNPTNYQIFIAMIERGCSAAPNPFQPPYNQKPSQYLLPASENTPLLNGSSVSNYTDLLGPEASNASSKDAGEGGLHLTEGLPASASEASSIATS